MPPTRRRTSDGAGQAEASQCGSMEAHERLAELCSSLRTNQNGPTDRPEEVTGTWTLAGDDTLVVTRASSSEPERVLRIVSAAPDRLVVAKS